MMCAMMHFVLQKTQDKSIKDIIKDTMMPNVYVQNKRFIGGCPNSNQAF
jgi:hypothetical protein